MVRQCSHRYSSACAPNVCFASSLSANQRFKCPAHIFPFALRSVHARILGTDTARGEILIKAQVPLSELEGYAAELKSVTAGKGRYSLDFSHYEPVPAAVQQRLTEAYKPRHEED